jgi:CRISPR/Cas system type I-B associated protein Csh2 (Cas7 group RAMP superfamily)
VLRQFRVTGTNAGKTLLGNESVRNEVGYTSMVDVSLEQEIQNAFISFEERILALSSSWFSSARSTESMMRGTSNEALVVNAL